MICDPMLLNLSKETRTVNEWNCLWTTLAGLEKKFVCVCLFSRQVCLITYSWTSSWTWGVN